MGRKTNGVRTPFDMVEMALETAAKFPPMQEIWYRYADEIRCNMYHIVLSSLIYLSRKHNGVNSGVTLRDIAENTRLPRPKVEKVMRYYLDLGVVRIVEKDNGSILPVEPDEPDEQRMGRPGTQYFPVFERIGFEYDI